MHIIYSDLNPQLGQSLYTDLVYNDMAINSSIGNILGINPKSRWYLPTFGSNLDAVLFEPIDIIQTQILETLIFDAIRYWENRIVIIESASRVSPNYDNQTYNIVLAYKYVNNNLLSGNFVAQVQGNTNNYIYK